MISKTDDGDGSIYSRLLRVMRTHLKGGDHIMSLDPSTTASDIDGWNSLSHTLLMMAIEDEFEVTLPLEATLEAENVGDLVRIIRTELK